MKRISIFLFLSMLLGGLSAQEINPLLYEFTWMDNETRVFNGYQITKIFGELPDDASTYNYSPITAVGFKPLSNIEADFNKVAQVQKWSDQEITENLSNIKAKALGGELEIYLTRYSEDRANLQWFFVILRDKSDKGKLWEYDLPYQAPQNPVQTGWWNYSTVDIPVELPDTFYVYLNDKKSKSLSDFKFLVEKIKK